MQFRLIGENGKLSPTHYGLIDSGADNSSFPAAWAEPLGIDLGCDCTAESCNTAGGAAKNHVLPAGIEAVMLGRYIRLAAAFNELLPFALLGREDFFGSFKVAFDQRGERFTLEAYYSAPKLGTVRE